MSNSVNAGRVLIGIIAIAGILIQRKCSNDHKKKMERIERERIQQMIDQQNAQEKTEEWMKKYNWELVE